MSSHALLHNIKLKRKLRKINHPSLQEGWESLSRQEQNQKMLQWKISVIKE